VWGVECRGKDTVGTGCLWTIGHLCLGNFRRRLARVYVILYIIIIIIIIISIITIIYIYYVWGILYVWGLKTWSEEKFIESIDLDFQKWTLKFQTKLTMLDTNSGHHRVLQWQVVRYHPGKCAERWGRWEATVGSGYGVLEGLLVFLAI